MPLTLSEQKELLILKEKEIEELKERIAKQGWELSVYGDTYRLAGAADTRKALALDDFNYLYELSLYCNAQHEPFTPFEVCFNSDEWIIIHSEGAFNPMSTFSSEESAQMAIDILNATNWRMNT
jgi:hypothetical protein